MKNLFMIALLFVASLGMAQNSVSITAQGNSIRTTDSGAELKLKSVVTAASVNGSLTTGVNLGSFVFTTPVVSSGNFQTGATFGPGGTIMVDSPSYLDYLGNFAEATWVRSKLADGRFYYTLTATFTSTEGAAAMVCTTEPANKPNVEFDSSAKLKSCSFGYNLTQGD